MDETPYAKGEKVGSLTATKSLSYLENFANELTEYGSLLNALEAKLDTVSERSPQTDSAEPSNDRVHIATLVGILARNNRRLSQLIQEIAL